MGWVNVADLLRPETLVYFLFFVVPGFVAMRTYELIVPSEKRSFGESFVDLKAAKARWDKKKSKREA